MSDSKNESSIKQSVVATVKMYWQIDRTAFISYVLLIILQVISSILAVYFASRIINELSLGFQDPANRSKAVYYWLIASTVTVLLERFAWRWLSLIERRSWIKWYMRISYDFNAAVSRLDMVRHHDAEFEKILTKLSQEYQYIPSNFSNDILRTFHSLARLVSTLFIVLAFAPLLVPLMLISLIPGYITERKLSKAQWTLWEDEGDKSRLAYRTTYYLLDKNKLQETKIFGTRQFLLNKLFNLYSAFYDKQLSNIRKIYKPATLSLIVEGFMLAGITAWLVTRVVNGSLSLGDFSFYSGILVTFGSSLGLLVNSVAFLYDKNEFMKDLFMLFNLEPGLPYVDEPKRIDKQTVPTIEFRNVSFKYPNSKKWALRNISMTIHVGDKVAFVGENGAGKTTIIKLLLRFYDCDEGTILINGVDIKELDLPSYYRHIGVLFQNFNDYPYSVRDNIALGRITNFNDDEKVLSSSKLANADDFIKDYPKGYEQILEVGFKDGIEPSGGQWQRIALARALFRDAGILILDEPTAAVDAKSEHQIFKTLKENSKHRTNIIISHRFSTVREANTIYVIHKGKIIESGDHSSLVNIKDGLYKEMFEKQAKGYR